MCNLVDSHLKVVKVYFFLNDKNSKVKLTSLTNIHTIENKTH